MEQLNNGKLVRDFAENKTATPLSSPLEYTHERLIYPRTTHLGFQQAYRDGELD